MLNYEKNSLQNKIKYTRREQFVLLTFDYIVDNLIVWRKRKTKLE